MLGCGEVESRSGGRLARRFRMGRYLMVWLDLFFVVLRRALPLG